MEVRVLKRALPIFAACLVLGCGTYRELDEPRRFAAPNNGASSNNGTIAGTNNGSNSTNNANNGTADGDDCTYVPMPGQDILPPEPQMGMTEEPCNAPPASTCERTCDSMTWVAEPNDGELVCRSCSALCPPDTSCSFECATGGCRILCARGSDCTSSCMLGRCKMICEPDATCDFSCGGGCNFECQQGSRCSWTCDKTDCSCTGPGCP